MRAASIAVVSIGLLIDRFLDYAEAIGWTEQLCNADIEDHTDHFRFSTGIETKPGLP